MRCVISVLGKDRAGIVAGISGVLAGKGASIGDQPDLFLWITSSAHH